MKRALVVAALVLAVAAVSPKPATALLPESCNTAAEFGGKAVYWNVLCFFDLLMDWT